jgi:hypothetical protein
MLIGKRRMHSKFPGARFELGTRLGQPGKLLHVRTLFVPTNPLGVQNIRGPIASSAMGLPIFSGKWLVPALIQVRCLAL